MKIYAALVSKLALGLLLLGTLGMITSTVLGFSDVVGTKFFDFPIPGTLEITESTMVLIVFGALAYTQSKRGHIRVEIVYNYFSPRGKALADFVTHLVAFIYFALLAWQGIMRAACWWPVRCCSCFSLSLISLKMPAAFVTAVNLLANTPSRPRPPSFILKLSGAARKPPESASWLCFPLK
jgi:TRAP-type C4-dicarboxylate transport system permease small subunit